MGDGKNRRRQQHAASSSGIVRNATSAGPGGKETRVRFQIGRYDAFRRADRLPLPFMARIAQEREARLSFHLLQVRQALGAGREGGHGHGHVVQPAFRFRKHGTDAFGGVQRRLLKPEADFTTEMFLELLNIDNDAPGEHADAEQHADRKENTTVEHDEGRCMEHAKHPFP